MYHTDCGPQQVHVFLPAATGGGAVAVVTVAAPSMLTTWSSPRDPTVLSPRETSQ